MAKRSKKSNSKTKKNPLFKDERLLKSVGILWLFLGAFFVTALFSYLFHWREDMDKVHHISNFYQFLLNKNIQVENAAGRLGAFTAHKIVFSGFGLASYFFIFLWFLIAYYFFKKNAKIKILQSIFYTILLVLIASPLFSFFFNSAFPYGGAFGEKMVSLLSGALGKTGVFALFVFIALIFIVLVFNPILHLPFVQELQTWYKNYLAKKAAENALKEQNKNEVLPEIKPEEMQQEQAVQVSFDENEIIEQPAVDEVISEDFKVKNPFEALEHNFHQNQEEPLPFIENPSENLTLEVQEISNPEPELSDVSHISDEPYDPSLELRNYKYPHLDLLENRQNQNISIDKDELEHNKNQILQTLKSFKIDIQKITATIGPTVTLYEIVPAEGVRISKIRNLEDDIALNLAALGIRIIAPIPGKGTIGIEVPNKNKQIVNMRTLLASEKFNNTDAALPIAIGKKIDNENYIVDLAKMPHLLMAGATGQGKSVGINAILVSLLYKKHPSQIKFVLVDPKKVELSIYTKIEKHFLAKLPNEADSIITDTKKVIYTINALCIEMDERYELLKNAGVRNISEYNAKFVKRKLNPEKGHKYLPYIVLVIDEFADLIMTAGKEIETPIARLAQLARAIGIHLIVATQRPSVNVITGTIKANFPSRIAFKVSAKVDSRTILDTGGAEQLIGRGDLLILNGGELVRLQCAFVDTPEVENIVDFIGDQRGYPIVWELPEYVGADDENGGAAKVDLKNMDVMFRDCALLVVTSESGSTSMLQRRFNLGYNRAGRIMDQLEAVGIVGPSIGSKAREVMIKTETELNQVFADLGI